MTTLHGTQSGVTWPPYWVDEAEEVATLLIYRLSSELGSVPGDVTVGLPYRAWSQSSPTVGEVVAAVRAQAEAVAGVVSSSVVASFGTDSLAVALEVDIQTSQGLVTRSVSTQVYSGTPSAWYLQAGG